MQTNAAESLSDAKYKGKIVGSRAPDFELYDQKGEARNLPSLLEKGSVLLAFYPNDFSIVCTKQLCNYRDNFDAFKELGLQIFGVSNNSVGEHEKFARRYDFPFSLLTDPQHKVAQAYGCRSAFMMGGVSRAVALINTQQVFLFRYVEPTIITHRKTEYLLSVARDLRKANLL